MILTPLFVVVCGQSLRLGMYILLFFITFSVTHSGTKGHFLGHPLYNSLPNSPTMQTWMLSKDQKIDFFFFCYEILDHF